MLFNFGAWHNDDATYASNVSSLVTYLLEHRAKLPYLIWRDTSPQHFNTPMGEFGCEGCSPPELPWKCQVASTPSLSHAPLAIVKMVTDQTSSLPYPPPLPLPKQFQH